MKKYNNKKRLQIAMRRLYVNNAPSKEMVSLLGTDAIGFKNHIDKYLIDGMTLENFGKVWGLDHIVPVELFDLSNEDELRLCYNYNNIMPMFNLDNRLKGASVHFSLQKLDTMPTNVYIEQLKNKCHEEINRTYQKYLV